MTISALHQTEPDGTNWLLFPVSLIRVKNSVRTRIKTFTEEVTFLEKTTFILNFKHLKYLVDATLQQSMSVMLLDATSSMWFLSEWRPDIKHIHHSQAVIQHDQC